MITRKTAFDTLKVLGLGDNVVDRYLNTGKMYPGGNGLNMVRGLVGAKCTDICRIST